MEERRPPREEPCWWLFILLPSGSTCPPRAPSPIGRPPHPSPPCGRAIQTRKGGKAVLGVGGRGNALPPKNRRREGAGPVSLRAGLRVVDPPQPAASAHKTCAGARRCRPRVPRAARASSLPPSTAAMVTALGPRLQRGLFAPAAAVASASACLRGAVASCAAPRSSPQLSARFPGPLCEHSRRAGAQTSRPPCAL